jgi:hypothetical protein
VRGTGRAGRLTVAQAAAREGTSHFPERVLSTLQRVIVHRCCTGFWENLPLGTKDLIGHENAMYPS